MLVGKLMRDTARRLTKQDIETLAYFRYQLRLFLRFSEKICQKHNVTPLQYLLLLHVRGFPGRNWATVSELSERLQAHHHGVVALVSRCGKQGLIERRPSHKDRRKVEIHLLPKGNRCLERLAKLHWNELTSLQKKYWSPLDIIASKARRKKRRKDR